MSYYNTYFYIFIASFVAPIFEWGYIICFIKSIIFIITYIIKNIKFNFIVKKERLDMNIGLLYV